MAVGLVDFGGVVGSVGALLAKVQVDADQLRNLSLVELEQLWRYCLPKQPIHQVKCLLWQDLAWHLQGGSLPITTQKLVLAAMKDASSTSAKSVPSTFVATLKPTPIPDGTRLVRKWRGRNYEVLVNESNFYFNGKRYSSLSMIAEEITGAHWSGPRFFGLSKLRKESVCQI